jgi:hypothetical protein
VGLAQLLALLGLDRRFEAIFVVARLIAALARLQSGRCSLRSWRFGSLEPLPEVWP